MIMTDREQTIAEAFRHARIALRSARYAVGRLEGLTPSLSPANCARTVEDAKDALDDGAIDAEVALAGFHRVCNM